MDKKNSNKADQNKPDKEDRGDNLKKIERVLRKTLDSVEDLKRPHPGGDSESRIKRPHPGGDSENRKITKVDKPKTITYKKSDDVKLKVTDHHNVSKENFTKKADELIKVVDKDDRRKTREKYTLRPRIQTITVNPAKKDEVLKLNLKKEESPKLIRMKVENAPKLNLKETPNVEVKTERPSKRLFEHKEKSKIDNSIGSATPEFLKADEPRDSFHRKPIIKTLTAKNDNSKIYKAVTFVDQKKKPTMLQIKIPNVVKNVKNVKTVETNTIIKRVKTTVSRASIKEKPVSRKKTESKRKKVNRKDYVASPDLSARIKSPQTEVAKWAPSSINRHTKPYYEAWVNTTLAAISKSSKKDKLFWEKQNILQSFQRALVERPETPDLIYENWTDEKYTGRIKVKQR